MAAPITTHDGSTVYVCDRNDAYPATVDDLTGGDQLVTDMANEGDPTDGYRVVDYDLVDVVTMDCGDTWPLVVDPGGLETDQGADEWSLWLEARDA